MVPTIPAIGNEKNTPVIPPKQPPANKANIIHNGCKFTLSPINFGVIKFPSINCPTANTYKTDNMFIKLNPLY